MRDDITNVHWLWPYLLAMDKKQALVKRGDLKYLTYNEKNGENICNFVASTVPAHGTAPLGC